MVKCKNVHDGRLITYTILYTTTQLNRKYTACCCHYVVDYECVFVGVDYIYFRFDCRKKMIKHRVNIADYFGEQTIYCDCLM